MLEERFDSIILVVFSNQNNSVFLFWMAESMLETLHQNPGTQID